MSAEPMKAEHKLVLMEAYLKAFSRELAAEGVDTAVVAVAADRAASSVFADVTAAAARIREEERR